MTIAKLFERIAMARLRQRCEPITADLVRFQMLDGEGDVVLSSSDWDALGERFRDAVRPSARGLFWSLVAAIPFCIFLLAVTAALPILSVPFDTLDRFVPGLSVLLFTSGLPLFAIARHMLAVQHAVDQTRAALATYPRVEATVPATRKRALHFFEIAALVFVGPSLLMQIYGSLNPDAFRNTPMMGTHLNASGIAGLIILVALALLRWMPELPVFGRRREQEAEGQGRRVDPLARARDA